MLYILELSLPYFNNLLKFNFELISHYIIRKYLYKVATGHSNIVLND